MTDQEAAELYGHVLARLRELNASRFAEEVEVTVGRGELRHEEGGKQSETLQTPLSPRESLIVALRMLVAAVEPPMHVADAEESLRAKVVWSFDELEPRQLPLEAGSKPLPTPRSAIGEAPELPTLTSDELDDVRSRARGVLRLALEMETGKNADADDH